MYVTNCFRNDGFGAQYQTIIYAAIFSEIVNKQFAYTPFKTMEHNYNNDLNFLNDKEKFINLIDNFPNTLHIENVEVLNFQTTRYAIESNINYVLQSNIFNKIKNLFFANKFCKFNNKITNIAVHIRRINKGDNSNCYGTHYENDEYYIKMINYLRSFNVKQIFHIYSQGNIEEFSNFKGDDIQFHLNEPLEDTFYDLTTADILVMSKGSFSYVAGLLSKGEVYYLPFWHPKLSTWKIL